MSDAGSVGDRGLDELIAEITVDAYDEDEQLMGFENAFDEEVGFPLSGAVVGEDVEVLSVGRRDGRRELIAACARSGRHYEVALLDVAIRAEPSVERLLAAYRRWSHASI